MTNEATRLAEEAKRLAREMRDIDPADCNASIPAEEAVDAAIDALAALAQPAVSEEAERAQAVAAFNGDPRNAGYGGYVDLYVEGWLGRAQLAAMASQEKPHD